MNNNLRGLLPLFILSFLNLTVLQLGQSQSCPNTAFPATQSDLTTCTPSLDACVTAEVEILSIYLEADPLLCVPCVTGDILSANVYAQLNNLTENNAAVGVFADLSDGINTCDFIKCNGPLLAQSATPGGSGLQDLFLGSISWICGQALSLQNITIVVGAPGNLCPLSCADAPVSCSFGIPNLNITMPTVSIIPDPGCDDGDCTNGVETWDGCNCVAGTAPVDPGCDDGICSNGLEIWDGCDCQPGTPPVDPGCDDGDCTNGVETWDGCMCQPGTPPADPGCDDGICANGIETWDGCNCVTGTTPVDCVTTIPQACNDNNPCTVNDTELVDACSGIVCVPCTGSGTMDCTIFTILACDDMNPCTINDQYQLDACSGDVCVPCEGTPVASCQVLVNQACDDLNPCTTNDIESLDACSGLVCVPCAGIPVNPPNCDPNCEIYNPATCGCDPILVMDCDDNNCATIDNYNPITCSCENIPIDDSACNDGLCYTIDYLDPITCLCVNEPITDVDCDDNNCATEDYFNYDTCECEYVDVCNNVTNAGWIGYDQGNCSAFDPAPLVSLEPASGGCGAIEYMWLKSNVNIPYYGDPTGPWTIIPNENGITYDPPFMASGVMCFLRCARTNTCTDFIGESNVVCITVGTTEVCNDWDCTTEDVFNTTTCECEYTVITTPNCDDNDCSTYDYFDAENCECVHEVTCDNVTYGGLIAGNQESCSAFDPDPITSLTEPSGGCGGLEYLWIASTHNVFSGSSTGSPWYTVVGANGPTYDPGVLTQTTYFRRCARRIGCSSWIGESNIICIEVGSAEVCDDGNCATLDAYDPDTCQCTHTPIDINCDDNDCSTEDLYDPLTCLCTHVVIPPPDCNDNDCTTEEFYDAANCQCVYTIVELPDCDDNNCATQDIFNQTTCECEYITLPPADCNDNDCNTIDSYNASTCSCENTPIDINTCDDNDCSTIDSYDATTCECINEPIQIPIECVIAPPATITLDACTSSVDPAIIGGAPVITTCVCVDFTIEYTDVNVGLPNTDCLSTIRTWTVVSNCGCEDVSLSYTQEIIQFNQIGPSITVPADLTVSASNDGCTREVSLMAVATAGGCSFGANATIEPSEITNSFTDGGADAFAAYPLGITNVVFTVEDDCGRTASGVTKVTVIDDIAPICVAQDITLFLDANGEAVVSPAQIDDGSSDACGTVSLEITPAVTYTCADLGQDLSVDLIVTDELGNSSSCSASITLVDQTPMGCVTAPPLSLTLDDCTINVDPAVIGGAPIIDANCDAANFNITYTDVNITLPNADCIGIERTWTVVSNAACSNVNLVYTQDIILLNQIGPSISVPADVTVSATDAGCTNSVNLVAVATAGSCSSGANAVIDPSEITNSFNGVGADASGSYPVGVTAVTFVVTDDCGRTASGVTSVTVIDDVPPVCVAQDVTLSLDVNGEAEVSVAQVDNGSSDVCGAVSLTIDPVVTYTCADVGQNLSVDLIVTDASGNVSTCSANVTIVDDSPMGCVTAPPVSLTLDDCVVDIDPLVIGGAPTIAANCDAADFNITFADVTIALPNADCIGIERTWTVVSNAGCNNVNLTYTQDIILLNQIGPSITAPADLTLSATEAGCTSSVSLIAVAIAGDCSSGANSVIDPSEVTNSFNAGGADASGSYPLGLTAVTFVVTDDCGRTASAVTNVTVVDDVPPICVAQDVTLFLDANGEAVLDVAEVDNGSSDVCGPVTLAVTPVVTYTCADIGQTLSVDLVVTDAAGNTSTCPAAITVVDLTEPMCFDNITVDLGIDGTYVIDPNEIIDGAVGACSGSVTLSADVTNLGCNNLGTEVCVTLTVTDQNGSTSTCKSIFNVEVDIPSIPAGICPADVTVDCGTDITDLSIFGEPDLTAPMDYCFHRFTTTESVIVDLDACDLGTITRTWTFLDPNGDQVLDVNGVVLSCTQVITVELGANVLTQADITCPADVTINCDETINDQPIIDLTNIACSGVVVSSVDVINDQNGLCDYTIERTFTITDQCQVAPAGVFTCVQIITVQDNTAPIISNLPADVTIDLTNEANTCSTVLEYAINIVDDCSVSGEIVYTIDAPGLIDAGTLDAAGNVNPMIEWCTSDSTTVVYVTATDACANVAIDSFEVVVIGEPCVSFFCEKFPFTLEADGDIELDSDVWIPLVVTNDCNHLEVDIAYSSDITDTLMTYGCDDITVMNMGNISDSIFFFIDGVLVDSCRVVVFFENDWETICNNNFTTGQIRGRVRNPEFEPVENVDMQLEGSQFVGIYTNENGRYAFPNMSFGGTYDVIPSKDEDHRNGVTTLDIVLAQRHILGLQNFESPYQHIAADVNKSNSISAADLIQMRKLILGVFDEFPSNTSWRIIDDAYTFPDPTDPLALKIDETHYIFGFEEDLNVDFTAVKIGDINYSAISSTISNNSEARSNRVLMLDYQDRDFMRDEILEVEFSMDEYETLDGFQFALSINPELLQVEEVITNEETLMGRQNYSDLEIASGMLPVSWHRTSDDMPKGKLFVVKLQAIGDGNLNSAIRFEKDKMSPEAYFNQEVAEISIAHNSMAFDEDEFLITGLYPVPFRTLVNLDMIAPRAAELTIDVFANTGERIRSERGLELKRGANSYQWDMGDLPEGHYVFRFTVNDEVFVRKMIKID